MAAGGDGGCGDGRGGGICGNDGGVGEVGGEVVAGMLVKVVAMVRMGVWGWLLGS